MYSHVRNRKVYGDVLPPSVEIKRDVNRLPRVFCRQYVNATNIDVLTNLPTSYPPYCHERSAIKEILFADDILAILTRSGVARAFDLFGGFKCELNPRTNNIHFPYVHTIVYNKENKTIIIAYAPIPSHLRCKVATCQSIREGKLVSPTYSFGFEQVVLNHPAFFEFCDSNKRIGAADLNSQMYRFWDMRTYKFAFEIDGRGCQEIRVSDGLIAMFDQPGADSLPLSLFDIESGDKLVETSIAIIPERKMQFLELLVSQLLIKQEGYSIKVHDLIRKKCIIVNNTTRFNPRGFVFYDTPFLEDGHKVYMQNTTRRFFTISFFSIDFWELDPSKMIHVKSIRINGMETPDLCCHSLSTNMFCIKSAERNDEEMKRPIRFHYSELMESRVTIYSLDGAILGSIGAKYTGGNFVSLAASADMNVRIAQNGEMFSTLHADRQAGLLD